jgi:16S rRNA G966 N2-methylase RsmD
MELKIKEEFKKLIPPLTPDEYKQLETNCIEEGIRDAIITWNGYIIDGHNRYKIAQDWCLSFKSIEKTFESEIDVRIWMRNNQKGRRNLTKAWIIELELGNKEDIALKGKVTQGKRNDLLSQNDKMFENILSQNDKKSILTNLSENKKIDLPKHNTQKEIAKLAGVSTGMIAMSEIVKEKKPELWQKAKDGEITVTNAYKEFKKEEKKEEIIQKKVEQERLINEIENHPLKDIETKIENGWYKVGKQFLYFGSNTDIEFKEFLPKAKFAFADPPYNAGVDDWDFNYKWELDYLQDLADIVAVTPGGWNAFNFYKETNMNYIWEMFCWISNGMTHGKCGYANVIKTSIFGNSKAKFSQDFWKINIKVNETEDTKHKGRKPYEFMSHLLEIFSNENDTIIDAFAGSGTTMVLCEKMNRISYNAELNKQYCIDIIKRIGTYERI